MNVKSGKGKFFMPRKSALNLIQQDLFFLNEICEPVIDLFLPVHHIRNVGMEPESLSKMKNQSWNRYVRD